MMKYEVKKNCSVVNVRTGEIFNEGNVVEVENPHDIDRPNYLIELVENSEVQSTKKKVGGKKNGSNKNIAKKETVHA